MFKMGLQDNTYYYIIIIQDSKTLLTINNVIGRKNVVIG